MCEILIKDDLKEFISSIGGRIQDTNQTWIGKSLHPSCSEGAMKYYEKYFSTNTAIASSYNVVFNHGESFGFFRFILQRNIQTNTILILSGFGPLFLPDIDEAFPEKAKKNISKKFIIFFKKLLELDFEINVFLKQEVCFFEKTLADSFYFKVRGTLHEYSVDLTQNIGLIKSNYRSRYKSLINKGIRTFDYIVRSHIDSSSLNNYRALHEKVSGKKTKHIDAWNELFANVSFINSFVVEIFYKNCLLGFLHVNKVDSHAIYSVGVFDNSLDLGPMSHAAINIAIEESINRNATLFILGYSDLNIQNEKDNGISHFKKGFCNQIKRMTNVNLEVRNG